MITVDWNNWLDELKLSHGEELDSYGEIFALYRRQGETCESFRKKVIFVAVSNIFYLQGGSKEGV